MKPIMAWAFLAMAGLFEAGWAIGLKLSAGFTRPMATVFTLLCMAISLWLLSMSAKTLPISLAYAVFTGIGAALTAILGIALFGESRDLLKILSILMIVSGVLGLGLVDR